MTIEAALHRALLRVSNRGIDLTSRGAIQPLLRDLFDGERIYLKELPDRKHRGRAASPGHWQWCPRTDEHGHATVNPKETRPALIIEEPGADAAKADPPEAVEP